MKQNEKHIIDQLTKRKSTLPSTDYFAQLKKNVLHETVELQAKKAKGANLFSSWYTYVAAAACIVLAVTLFWEEEKEMPRQAKLDLSVVSRSELLEYVEAHMEDFDTESIASLSDTLPNHLSPSIQVSTPSDVVQVESKNDVFKELDKQEILDYLDEHAIDIDEELIYGT